jgi:hypothetical protein
MASIELKRDAFRKALNALKNMYDADTSLYFSVENGRFQLESAGGAGFYVYLGSEGADLPMQKTSVGAFTANLSLLNEYSDLVVDRITLCVDTNELTVTKKATDTDVLLQHTKKLTVLGVSESEKEAVLKNRENFKGDVRLVCPPSIANAVAKVNILKGELMYLRGKYVYAMSGEGVCRVFDDNLHEDTGLDLDTAFMVNLVKLDAENYTFYAGFALCEVDGATFYLSMPQRATERELSATVIEMFGSVTPSIRVYWREVVVMYGATGGVKLENGSLTLNSENIKLGAPYVLPLVETSFNMLVSDAVTRAAGDVWTAGMCNVEGRRVGLVSGDCDVLFTAKGD